MSMLSVSLAAHMMTSSLAAPFVQPAQTLSALMPKISEWSGQKLTVSNLLANEVVYVSLRDASPDDAKTKLADVVGGVWVKTSDGERLDLDTSRESKEVQAKLVARTTFLKSEIDKLTAELAKAPTFDAAKMQAEMQKMREQFQQNQAQNQGQPPQPGQRGPQGMMGMQNRMPGGRAIIQTLQAMRAEDLARIGIGQRVVFSSRPTAMQRPLPGNSLTVMRSFVADEQKMGTAFPRRQQNGGQGRAEAPPPPQSTQQTTQVAQPAKAFLIVTRPGFGDGLMLNYVVADSTGMSLGNGNLMLGQNFGGPQGQNGSESAPTAGSNDKLKLSDASIAAAKAFARGGGFGGGRGRGFGGPDQGTTVDPQLSKLMKDPSANEPLQFHVQEAIQTVAQDKNCVALLPDSLLTSLGRVLSSGISLDSLTKTLSSDEGYEASSADGWFTFAPKFRIDSRNSRVDRAALKTLLQAISQKGSARLDDIAVYATRSPYQSGGLDLNIVRMVDPASAGDVGQVYGDDRDMLLMWAGMSPNTRSTLANGRKLQINSVSMSAHKLLGGLVFNSNDGPNVTAQAQTQIPSGAVAQVTIETFRVQQGRGPGGRGGRGGFNSNLATERTELLPNGVSTMSLLSMQVEEEPVTKATQSTAGLARTMTARDMAREKAFSEMPQDPNGGGRPQRPVINWDGYVAGTQISRTFVFELANNVTITRTLQDTSFSPGSKSGSFDALPDSFRAAYQESYENMKNRGNDRGDGRAAGRRGRNGNGQRPPGP